MGQAMDIYLYRDLKEIILKYTLEPNDLVFHYTTSFVEKIKNHSEYCFPDTIKNIQAAKLVIKYINDHPEELNHLPTMIILKTYKKYFPCP